MLDEGGFGIAHLDFDLGNNALKNLKYVTEAEARAMLMAYDEPAGLRCQLAERYCEQEHLASLCECYAFIGPNECHGD